MIVGGLVVNAHGYLRFTTKSGSVSAGRFAAAIPRTKTLACAPLFFTFRGPFTAPYVLPHVIKEALCLARLAADLVKVGKVHGRR